MSNHLRHNQSCLLEVIACTVEDAIEAERGGAGRLEVISRFDVGGLTPAPELVREIKAKVSIPVRVMLRESEGYGVGAKRKSKSSARRRVNLMRSASTASCSDFCAARRRSILH
jgi:copper homeostasis protein CutC